MSKQLHKNFVDEQVKLLLKSYVDLKVKQNSRVKAGLFSIVEKQKN